jgi:hypothetical protein
MFVNKIYYYCIYFINALEIFVIGIQTFQNVGYSFIDASIYVCVADCGDEFRKIAKTVKTVLVTAEFYTLQIIAHNMRKTYDYANVHFWTKV